VRTLSETKIWGKLVLCKTKYHGKINNSHKQLSVTRKSVDIQPDIKIKKFGPGLKKG
jgi:hypothetical protein